MNKYRVNYQAYPKPNNDPEIHQEEPISMPLEDGADPGHHTDFGNALTGTKQYVEEVDRCAVYITGHHNS